MSSIIAASGQLAFPSWGRSFWQDPNNGELICLYASGTTEVNYIRSTDGGVTWDSPQFAFPVDDFSTHDNFDTSMDRDGNVHCVHRFNGSGCYSLLAKVAGGWAPSGVVARGFFATRATVPARDFNGTIDVWDTGLGLSFADPTTPPAAQMAAVDSTDRVRTWYLDSPYTAWPSFRAAMSDPVGSGGGFPIVHGAGFSESFGTVYYLPTSGLVYADFRFSSTAVHVENIVEIEPTGILVNGSQGRAALSPNMGWCRTQVGPMIPILATTSGYFDLYSITNEPQGGTGGGSTAFFGSMRSIQPPDGTSRIQPTGELTFADFLTNIAGADTKLGTGGIPVDISYTDEFANINLYFLQRKENGDQTIYRLKANLEQSLSSQLQSRTVYTFSTLSDPASGIVSWADVNYRTAGAGNASLPNIVHWHGFKALKHPTAAQVGTAKQEIIMTIGSGLVNELPDSEAKLYAWRFEDSLAGSGKLTAPTYVFDYTAQSGNLLVQLSTNGMTNADNFFDQNIATSGDILNADQFTLEFSQPLSFNRVEFVWSPTPLTFEFINVDIQTSFDGVNFDTVFTIPTGQCPPLTTASAENDRVHDPTIEFEMDAFAGKYLRMNFSKPGPVFPLDVREIRLYGGNHTSTFISTSGFTTTLELSSPIPIVETFNNAPTGLPAGWRTYGDFNWSVEAGTIDSGVFTGQTIGSGDASAVRTDRDPGPNESGVLEVDLNVVDPRIVTFDMRLDLKSNIGQINPVDPNDDLIEVFVVTPTGTIRLSDDAVFAGQYLVPTNYYTVTVPVTTPGLNTIRWVYTRGNLSIGQSPKIQAEAAAWIDNVRGLDGDIPFGTIYGYLLAEDSENEEINGYMEGAGAADTFSFAWMNTTESALTGVINGFHQSEVAATGFVNAYMASTGDFETFAGYMEGFIDTAIGTINGYMLTSGSFDFIFGHAQSRFNESINGYLLAPSGAFSSINAYMFTPEFLVINGYLKTQEETNVQVNAYLKADGIGDQINGFMLASGLPSGSINAYIRADGAFDNFNGYMITGDDTDIAGYIHGAAAITGVINAWISGVGEIANSIDAYIPGISGVAQDNINGFISAVEVPANSINGYIIGFGEDDQCNFPVPNEPFATVPTGNFFG